MKNYTTLGVVTIRDGELKLSSDQAKRRTHCLTKTRKKGGNIYKVVGTVTFKRGEVIGLENVSKIHAPLLEEIKGK